MAQGRVLETQDIVREPSLAVCFFGITRSLSHTLPSIETHALGPARAAGPTRVYAHFFRQRSLAQARTGETGALDPDEHRLLHPDWLDLEEPGPCLETWDFDGLKTHGDSWADDFQSLRNLVHQLHSLKRVTDAALADGAEVCLFLRPDLRYHDSLQAAISRARRAARAGRALVQLPDWQAWHGGLNDRFAIVAGPPAIRAYGTRVTRMAAFCAARQAPLHSEQLLAFALAEARTPVRTIRARATRVRMGGVERDEEFLPTWVVRLRDARDRRIRRVRRAVRLYSLPEMAGLAWARLRPERPAGQGGAAFSGPERPTAPERAVPERAVPDPAAPERAIPGPAILEPAIPEPASRPEILPRLAVVLPCYNAEGWVARALDSVLAQDHPDLRVIAVDDGSTDGTLALLRAYGDAVTVETGPNRGACHARNRGLGIAAAQQARHVVFLDCDDFLDGPILRHAAALAVQAGADLVLSDTDILTAEGLRIVRRQHAGRVAPEALFISWLQGGFLMTGSLLWRLDFVRQIGWDESLSQFQDSDLVLRALLRRPLIVKNDTGVGVYTKENPEAISRKLSRRHVDSRLRVSLGLLPRIAGTSFAPALPDLCWKLYKTARLAFLHGFPDLGRRAMRGIRQGSTQGPVRAWNWGLLARLIGLRTRVWLRQL